MYAGDYHAVSRVASEDMATSLFIGHAVDPTATNFKVALAQAGGGFGILSRGGLAGKDVTVVDYGETQARVGKAVAAGDWAAVANSGWLINVASTTAITVIGRFITAAASGMLAVVKVNPWRGPTA